MSRRDDIFDDVGISVDYPSNMRLVESALDFGPVTGTAGQTIDIKVAPQCPFKGQKLIVNDTASPPGTGTRITRIIVGNKLQYPTPTGGSLSTMFSYGALGNGISWDTCPAAITIIITVQFLADCRFDASVFGKMTMGG